jgi:hypothetical protein
MTLDDFNTEFNDLLQQQRVVEAGDRVMQELAKTLVDNKRDFVNLLNESGVQSNIIDSDIDLINKYADNLPKNKKLAIGSALLTQSRNKVVGADGTQEISDKNVRNVYDVLKSCFSSASVNDERYSNAVDPVTAIAEASGKAAEMFGKGIDLTSTIVKGKQEQKTAGQKLAAQQTAAKSALFQSALDYKKSKAEQAGKGKTTAIIAISGVLVIGIIVAIVAMKRKK